VVARYEQVAADLRKRITEGEFQVGEKLPTIRALSGEYACGSGVSNKAVKLLEQQRYVVVLNRSGVEVVDHASPRTSLLIGHAVHHDGTYGYFYNPLAGNWGAIGTPTRRRVHVDRDVAELLGVPVGTTVLGRRRVVGPKGRGEQITTTWFAPSVSDRFDTDDTGPGGWMQQVEQPDDVQPGRMGLGPMTWRCSVSARSATTLESQDLRLPRRANLLLLAFVVTPRGWTEPIAVDVMALDAARYRVEHAVPRAASARWPVIPATGRNAPSTIPG
jgi:DNA-binding GntR family transcriptional regulator